MTQAHDEKCEQVVAATTLLPYAMYCRCAERALADKEEVIDALAKKCAQFEADREYNAGLVREKERALAQARLKSLQISEPGWRQLTIDSIAKERDALRAQVARLRCY